MAHRAEAQGFAVETVRQPDDGDWTSAVLAAIERSGAPPVALASISSVHWSDGGLIDLDKVAAALRRHGALFLIDATQSAGVLPMDVKALDPDFVMFPTYKWLLGPYGRAFLYVAKRHQDGIPLEQTAGRPPQRARRERGLFHRPRLRRRRQAFRHGRARSFHFAGDGRDRHGDGGRMGRAAIAQRLAMLTGRIEERVRGLGVSCPGAPRAGAAYPVPWVSGRDAERAGRGTCRATASTSRRALAACASRRTSSTTKPILSVSSPP